MCSSALHRFNGFCFLAACIALCSIAHAQNYPVRPIRWIVGASVGGGNDLVARMVAEKLSLNVGRPVVVENRTGASSMIGMEIAAKSQPDGYTLYLISATATINQALGRNVSVDVLRDFEAITRMTSQPNVLLVPSSSPAHSVKELIAYARSRAGQLNYGSSGTGTSSYLSAELFNHMAKTDIKQVPYKGGVPVLIDLVAGRTDLTFGLLSSTQAHVNAGRLRALAVTSKSRLATVPDVPTIHESGLPGYEVVGWYGAVVSRGTPVAIVNFLNSEIRKVMQLPDVRERIRQDAAEVTTASSEQFAKDMREDVAKWSKLVKDANLQVDQ